MYRHCCQVDPSPGGKFLDGRGRQRVIGLYVPQSASRWWDLDGECSGVFRYAARNGSGLTGVETLDPKRIFSRLRFDTNASLLYRTVQQ
jgi:hypothetical protein